MRHRIADMYVRGAPLIGATAAWGLYLAALENPEAGAMRAAAERLLAARPTAVNLRWAVERIMAVVDAHDGDELAAAVRRDEGRNLILTVALPVQRYVHVFGSLMLSRDGARIEEAMRDLDVEVPNR